MNNLSIAIQHTPDRADRRQWAQAITAQLRREAPDIRLAVIEDTKREGCWPTYRRALEAVGSASHHLVLQDDIELCRDFIRSVEGPIRARPNNLIALYTNSCSVLTVRDRRESWLEKLGASGPAVIWPCKLIGEFLEWQDRHVDQSFEWDTVRVSMWLIKTSKKAFVTVPSLTQHLGWDSSTMGLNDPNKVATWYIGKDRSAVDIDWSQGLESSVQDTTGFRAEWWKYYRE